MKTTVQKSKIYLVLLIDREHARMFTITNGIAGETVELESVDVPQNVKHGDDTWDAQDKIFRHIEDHLHRHIEKVAKEANEFAKNEKITGLLIGSHKPLFGKIEKHLKYPLSKKVIGSFVTELKVPKNEILKRALKLLETISARKEVEELEKALQ